MIKQIVLLLMILISSSTIACAEITVDPNNYSQHLDNLITQDMEGWDFLENGVNLYITMIGATLFWIIILLIPYISLYNRQHGVILVSVVYLFSGGVIAQVMPAEFGTPALWMVVLAITGLIYKMFIDK